MGFPGGSVDKESTCNAEDAKGTGSFSGLGRSPGGGHASPLQYSCLENPMERGAWQAIAHRVTKTRTQRKQLITHTHTHTHTQSKRGCRERELKEQTPEIYIGIRPSLAEC